MPYNFVANSFYTKKLCTADFLQAKCDFIRKTAVLRFEPFLATYDDHLRLTGKRVAVKLTWLFVRFKSHVEYFHIVSYC